MSVPAERLPQGEEERRGEYAEGARTANTPALAASGGAAVWPLLVDGRAPITPTGTPGQVTSAVVAVGAQTGDSFPVTVTTGTGKNFQVGGAQVGTQNVTITAVNGDVLTMLGFDVPPVAAQVVTQSPFSGAGGRGDTGGFIRRVQATPQAALVGAATNFVTIQIGRYLNAVQQALLGAPVAFNAAAETWAANTPADLGVTGQLQPGEVLCAVFTGTGTGLAVPAILWTIEYTRLGI